MSDEDNSGVKPEEMLPCMKRNPIVRVENDGSIRAIFRCANQICEKFTLNVIQDDCSTCAVRVPIPVVPKGYVADPPPKPGERSFKEPKLMPDGSIVYEKVGWEIPPPHPGYRRKSNDPNSPDAWVFVPLALPCLDRMMINHIKPSCGCLQVNAICVSETSGYKNHTVTHMICEKCPVRRT